MVAVDWIYRPDLHPHHRLKLEYRETPYNCDGCKEPGFHARYTCQEESCNFHLHKHCVDPPPSLRHPFYKNSVFLFSDRGKPRHVCDACGMGIKGSVYRCSERDKDLHPCCANLELVIEDGDELRLVLKKEMPSKCYCCGMKKADGTSAWGYVSTCNTYCLHIACAKKMIVQNWVVREGGGGAAGGRRRPSEKEITAAGETENRESLAVVVKRTPLLQLAVVEKKGDAGGPAGKLAKMKRFVGIAIPFIIAAIVGDPTAIVAGLIANLISH